MSTPSQQAKYLRAFAPPPTFQPDPVAGFAPLDWSEARYYGFDAASLQNADSQFVGPTAQTVDTALAHATRNGDGTLSFSATAKIPGAYPMPTVIYAIVPTDRLTALEASNIDGMLSRLLSFTTGARAATDLPDGYGALPTPIAAEARADLASAIRLETPARTATPRPPPTATTPPTTAPTAPPPATPPASKRDPSSPPATRGHARNRPGGPARHAGASAIPLEAVALAGTPAALLLPGVFWAGGLALLGCGVLLLIARRRRPARVIPHD